MKKLLKYFGYFILCIVVYNFVTLFYRAEPISGVVRDATTGQPLAGVVVVATWYSQVPGPMAPRTEEFEVQEATTDAQGRYTIPGWWIKFLPRVFASISTEQPSLFVYKYGYFPRSMKNIFDRTTNGGTWKDTHTFFIRWYEPKDIKITEVLGTEKEKIEFFEPNPFTNLSLTDGCRWKKVVNYLLEVDKQIQDGENYYAKSRRDTKQLEPWFVQESYPNKSLPCPGIVERLTDARKLRK
jgi:hypothetical protein